MFVDARQHDMLLQQLRLYLFKNEQKSSHHNTSYLPHLLLVLYFKYTLFLIVDVSLALIVLPTMMPVRCRRNIESHLLRRPQSALLPFRLIQASPPP